jgi:hypothetical protein
LRPPATPGKSAATSIRTCSLLAIDGMTSWPGFWYRESGPRTPHEIGTQFLEFLLGSVRVGS